ncbi:uncharacterized protein TA13990 [Theileria annulata]|uniref:Uncharacterized protein n=1 Tax=Theileria annulata TaxID=5874 RepID=Q4UET9_THEAN|nr:uncharacterized protein TA13990 [Theileria annulata]CAI74400.1 hypothetical protein TA13990 [Theileria annulata]|eukprot:XP_952132.1 hypothetical protein TA13990 [Theileria annulata]
MYSNNLNILRLYNIILKYKTPLKYSYNTIHTVYDIKDKRDETDSIGFDKNDLRKTWTNKDDIYQEFLDIDLFKPTVETYKVCKITNERIRVNLPIDSLEGYELISAIANLIGISDITLESFSNIEISPNLDKKLINKHSIMILFIFDSHELRNLIQSYMLINIHKFTPIEIIYTFKAFSKYKRYKSFLNLLCLMFYDHMIPNFTHNSNLRSGNLVRLDNSNIRSSNIRLDEIILFLKVLKDFKFKKLTDVLYSHIYDHIYSINHNSSLNQPITSSIENTVENSMENDVENDVEKISIEDLILINEIFFKYKRDPNFVELYTKIHSIIFKIPLLDFYNFEQYTLKQLNLYNSSVTVLGPTGTSTEVTGTKDSSSSTCTIGPSTLTEGKGANSTAMECTMATTVRDTSTNGGTVGASTVTGVTENLNMLKCIFGCRSEFLISSVHHRIEFKRLWKYNIINNNIPWKFINPVTVLGHTDSTVVPGTSTTGTIGASIVTEGKGANSTGMECTPGKGANSTGMECTPGKGANFTAIECTGEKIPNKIAVVTKTRESDTFTKDTKEVGERVTTDGLDEGVGCREPDTVTENLNIKNIIIRNFNYQDKTIEFITNLISTVLDYSRYSNSKNTFNILLNLYSIVGNFNNIKLSQLKLIIPNTLRNNSHVYFYKIDPNKFFYQLHSKFNIEYTIDSVNTVDTVDTTGDNTTVGDNTVGDRIYYYKCELPISLLFEGNKKKDLMYFLYVVQELLHPIYCFKLSHMKPFLKIDLLHMCNKLNNENVLEISSKCVDTIEELLKTQFKNHLNNFIQFCTNILNDLLESGEGRGDGTGKLGGQGQDGIGQLTDDPIKLTEDTSKMDNSYQMMEKIEILKTILILKICNNEILLHEFINSTEELLNHFKYTTELEIKVGMDLKLFDCVCDLMLIEFNDKAYHLLIQLLKIIHQRIDYYDFPQHIKLINSILFSIKHFSCNSLVTVLAPTIVVK